MRKDPTRKTLETIQDLRSQGESEAALAKLESILQNGAGIVVASAAKLVADWFKTDLAERLVAAFKRLSKNGQDDDPQCWGKTALIKALHELAWPDAKIYLQACRTVQLEPVRGGQEDSAAPVRTTALNALVQLPVVPTHDLMITLVDLLADGNASVRAEAARSSIYGPAELISPVLRLKIRLGDADARVLGTCFDALLVIAPIQESIDLIAEFLPKAHPFSLPQNDDVLQVEALASLASSSLPAAVLAATSAYPKLQDPQIKRIVLTSLGGSASDAALEFLYATLAASDEEATWAFEALRPKLHDDAVQDKVRQQLEVQARDDLLAQL